MTTPLIKIIPDFSTTLASKVAVGATSASLSTATDINGDTLATGKYGFTIDRKNSSKEYFTATLTGTSLTNVATIDITDGSETAGFAKEHRKTAEIIISDFVAIKRIQDVLETGYVDTYVPTTDYQIATKAYADGLTVGGAPNADETTKGIAEVATVAEINAGASVGSTGASLIVTPDKLKTSSYTTRLDALEVAIPAPIRRVYTSSGTWTKPAGLKYIEVEVQGASGYVYGEELYGTGGGGYARKLFKASDLSATESYTVGTKGLYSSRTNATNSVFKSVIGGASVSSDENGSNTGTGGTASGGDINIPGQQGGNNRNITYTDIYGDGGNSFLGFGGRSGGNRTGTGYGGGIAGSPSNVYLDGLDGVIILTEYY